jgi:phage FluMu protein Com
MDLEEQEGVDPVIERRCAECGATLTEAEIKAALETGGPYMCTVHANDEVALDEDAAAPG